MLWCVCDPHAMDQTKANLFTHPLLLIHRISILGQHHTAATTTPIMESAGCWSMHAPLSKSLPLSWELGRYARHFSLPLSVGKAAP